MELTTSQAFDLLRQISSRVVDARSRLERAIDVRDALIREFDGQQGMSRTAMADACGITRMALWKALDRRPEGVEEDVLMDDALVRALREIASVDELAELDRMRLHVAS